jgi:hypothetical protein
LPLKSRGYVASDVDVSGDAKVPTRVDSDTESLAEEMGDGPTRPAGTALR